VNPVWNQQFVYDNVAFNGSNLTVQIWEKNKLADKKNGSEVKTSLAECARTAKAVEGSDWSR
jgi:hypothetical protein